MAETTIHQNLQLVLAEMQVPSVTQWNRLEGRPRTQAFDRSLRAEVRDGLWMLARQWQMGEFRADDAGAPVLAQMRMDHTRLTKVRLGPDAVEPLVDPLPLETRAERLPVRLTRGGRKIALDLRLLLGRRWLKRIAAIGAYASDYLTTYPLAAPDPEAPDQADVCAHPATFALFAALAGRAMDGGELYLHLKAGGRASDGIAALSPGDPAALDTAGEWLVTWFERLVVQPEPGDDGAWIPDRLEYQLAASAPKEGGGAKVYRAREYPGGRLDWSAFDVDPEATGLEDEAAGDGAAEDAADDPGVIGAEMRTVIPAPLQYDGMPNARWWAFEDGRTNFGAISAATTDLGKLLFMEFALVYSNDWFLAPFTLPAGTIADLAGCAVTNTFGERFWIRPAGAGLDDDPRRFTLFTSSVEGEGRLPADTSLLLMPIAQSTIDGPDLEEVLLVRDEMANMVWGVERTVPLPDGTGVPGREAARETRAFYERLVADGPAPDPGAVLEAAADIRYKVMQSVPENWIPFVAARVPGSDRQIRLQRAAMPRVIPNDPTDPPTRIEPLTALLRAGLEAPRHPYFLHEEEVPREGVRVVTRFQRARWIDGRVVVWLGARKLSGRGESSSGLAFDQIVPTPRP